MGGYILQYLECDSQGFEGRVTCIEQSDIEYM